MIQAFATIANFKIAIQDIQRDFPFLKDRKWLAENLEEKLTLLQSSLLRNEFTPESTEYFYFLYEKWLVKAKLSCPELIVETALTNYLEQWFKASWTSNCFHQMQYSERLVATCQQWKKNTKYVYKTDVKQFFASIDHLRLINQVNQQIKEEQMVALLGRFLNSFDMAAQSFAKTEKNHPYHPQKGLPVGLRLSYFLASLFLHSVDQTMVQQFPTIHYARYVDDIILFGPKSILTTASSTLNNLLAALGLQANLAKTTFQATNEPITFLRTGL